MNKKIVLFGLLLILIFSVSYASAEDINDNSTICEETSDIEQNLEIHNNPSNILESSNSQNNFKSSEPDEIIVNDWDELQYYCSLSDKDYTLRLKENTN